MNKIEIHRLLKAILIILTISFLYGISKDILTPKYRINKKHTMSYLYENTEWGNMGTQEQARYTRFMYDVIDTFSSRNTTESLTKDERINYARHNYKLAKAFSYGLFDVPIFHILETALNPYIIGEQYNEVGMGHYWYGTARDYWFYARSHMPSDLWRLVKFDLEKPQDLQDPINSLKMGYIFLWKEKRTYKGIEAWYIPAVRWGRFFHQLWENGKGDLPIRFTIVTTLYGIKRYNARAYYWAWRNMRLAFEKGDLNAGLYAYRKWKRKEDKLKEDWAKHKNAYYVIKKQNKIIERLLFFDEMSRQEKIQAKKEWADLHIKMKRLGIEAREKGWDEKLRDRLDKLIKKIGAN